MKIESLVPENIRRLKPYSSARMEFSGKAEIFLDANENPFGDNIINRYPDPRQMEVLKKLSYLKNISAENMMLGNGSDELIDLLIRLFCEPKKDKLLYCPPTFGMYQVAADINNVETIQIPLDVDYNLDTEKILDKAENAKMIFLCSPNNPTGNLMSVERIEKILKKFNGIVVVDEAYIEFTGQASFINRLDEFANLVVLQTFSKYWGLTGARLGMVYANKTVIDYLLRIKPPYNVNVLTAEKALARMEKVETVEQQKKILSMEKEKLLTFLESQKWVEKIYPSDANFLFLKAENANKMYKNLLDQGIVVRNFSKKPGTKNCLRISVGTPEENEKLISLLK